MVFLKSLINVSTAALTNLKLMFAINVGVCFHVSKIWKKYLENLYKKYLNNPLTVKHVRIQIVVWLVFLMC
jgi:hypothetical protein